MTQEEEAISYRLFENLMNRCLSHIHCEDCPNKDAKHEFSNGCFEKTAVEEILRLEAKLADARPTAQTMAHATGEDENEKERGIVE